MKRRTRPGPLLASVTPALVVGVFVINMGQTVTQIGFIILLAGATRILYNYLVMTWHGK